MKTEGILSSGRPFVVETVRRCAICKTELTEATTSHGVKPGAPCPGQPAGRELLRVWVAQASRNAYRGGRGSPQRWRPNHWSTAKGLERAEALAKSRARLG